MSNLYNLYRSIGIIWIPGTGMFAGQDGLEKIKISALRIKVKAHLAGEIPANGNALKILPKDDHKGNFQIAADERVRIKLSESANRAIDHFHQRGIHLKAVIRDIRPVSRRYVEVEFDVVEHL